MSSPESGRNSHLQWAPPVNVYIFVYPWNRRMKTCFAQNRATVTSAESFYHVELLLEDDDDDDDDDHDDDHVYFQMVVYVEDWRHVW